MVTMEAAGMVSKRVEAAAWVGATVAVTRTEAASVQSTDAAGWAFGTELYSTVCTVL